MDKPTVEQMIEKTRKELEEQKEALALSKVRLKHLLKIKETLIEEPKK